MKTGLLAVIHVLMWPFRLCITERMSAWKDWILNACYAARVKNRFRTAKALIASGRPFTVRNGKCIALGEGVSIGRFVRLEAVVEWRGQTFHPHIDVDDHAVLNAYCHIGCIDSVHIGRYSTIGERTYITDHVHGVSSYAQLQLPPRHRPLYSKGGVWIGDFVAVGEGCAILPGVTIGDHCIVGTNAVVTKSFPPYSIIGGNPARLLKTVTPDDEPPASAGT